MNRSGLQRQSRNRTILIVEDPFVRSFLRTLLTRFGFTVLIAEEHEAMEGLRTGRLTPDLLITNRPGRFTYEAHRIPLLYLAAYPDPHEATGFRHSHLLNKPFHPQSLLDAVKALLSPVAATR